VQRGVAVAEAIQRFVAVTGFLFPLANGKTPDVADDLIKRVGVLWKDSLTSMLETNTWQAVDPDYDEEED